MRTELEDFGFAVNPYDSCIANFMVNRSQMTVAWHVDDLKISHKDSLEVTNFLHHFGQIYDEGMVVHCDKVHDYLGKDLDFSTTNTLKVGIINYMKKTHKDFRDKIKYAAATPDAEQLFDVREDNQDRLLPEGEAIELHHSTAQLIFLCVCAQPDICTSVSFLCTRCNSLSEDDWGKLNYFLKYIFGMRHMKLCLSVDELRTLMWWVDTSYALH